MIAPWTNEHLDCLTEDAIRLGRYPGFVGRTLFDCANAIQSLRAPNASPSDDAAKRDAVIEDCAKEVELGGWESAAYLIRAMKIKQVTEG